jgi:hypothetical protein
MKEEKAWTIKATDKCTSSGSATYRMNVTYASYQEKRGAWGSYYKTFPKIVSVQTSCLFTHTNLLTKVFRKISPQRVNVPLLVGSVVVFYQGDGPMNAVVFGIS